MGAPTEYLPRTYHRRVSTYWWLAHWRYFTFILRESSAVFVAWTVVITLLQIRAVTHGPADYAAIEAWLRRPPVLVLNGVSFLFVLFHTVTWFNLAPKAMVLRVGGARVPGAIVVALNYVVWLVASVVVARFILRG